MGEYLLLIKFYFAENTVLLSINSFNGNVYCSFHEKMKKYTRIKAIYAMHFNYYNFKLVYLLFSQFC